MMAAMAIVVVGSINLDLVATVVRFPSPGETIVGRSFAMHPGGKGANQAVAAARMGAQVRMIGMLGDDAFASILRAGLEREGIDTAGVGAVEGSSGVASITVNAHGENMIVIAAGANNAVTPEYLPIETVLELGRLCAERQIPLMLDPAPARELPADLFPLLTWFTPNETEAAFYLDPATQGSATALLSLGLKGVILKQGARGAMLATASEQHRAAAPAVTAVDTTAAGDTCNGAFAAAIASGLSASNALDLAAAAAALSVTREGAQPSMPTRSEVEAFLLRLKERRGLLPD
jgi:ribokinase